MSIFGNQFSLIEEMELVFRKTDGTILILRPYPTRVAYEESVRLMPPDPQSRHHSRAIIVNGTDRFSTLIGGRNGFTMSDVLGFIRVIGSMFTLIPVFIRNDDEDFIVVFQAKIDERYFTRNRELHVYERIPKTTG